MLEALHKMGNRDYARALEKPLNNPDLLMMLAQWVGEHRLTAAEAMLLSVVENPPPKAVGGRHSVAIEALGKIGNDNTAARLTAMLQRLTSRAMPEFFDRGVIESIIGALATLEYKPARAAVEEAFFYWLGVDSSFADKPDLLELKRELEHGVEREAVSRMWDLLWVDARALVFLVNRRKLATGAATQPDYRCALHVDAALALRPHLDAESLKGRLNDLSHKHKGAVSVARNGLGTEGDPRLYSAVGTTFFWNYGRYVHATRDPRDLRFVEFLLASGLADNWGAKNELAEALKTAPDE
jgi:hypothetical protein